MIAEVAAMVAAEPLAARPIPAPQFGNPPHPGRPPVEQFPRPIPAPAGQPPCRGPELDGSWTIHGLGVRLSSAAIVTLAESSLEHAQPDGAR